jgi:hypothetical protein
MPQLKHFTIRFDLPLDFNFKQKTKMSSILNGALRIKPWGRQQHRLLKHACNRDAINDATNGR